MDKNKPIVLIDIVYNFGKTLLSETELQALQTPSNGHLPILAEHIEIHAVRVIRETYSKKINTVDFHFFKGQTGRVWLPLKMHAAIKKLNPDIIIVHGFSNPVQLLLLCIQSKATIVGFYNGGGIPGGLGGKLQKLCRYFIKHYVFTSSEQVQPFINANLIKKNALVYEIPEASTMKVQVSKTEARQRLQLSDDATVFLWVGTLTANKDPLTVLNGLSEYFSKHPEAQLLMIYRTDQLLANVLKFINENAHLKSQITLVGALAHHQLDDYYSASDYFVLGSHYEGSGYSLIESMACGCIPLVTRIPSFIKLTNNGELGSLWETGNITSFKMALHEVLRKDKITESQKVITYFKKELSFEAIARKQLEMIQQITSKKRLKNN